MRSLIFIGFLFSFFTVASKPASSDNPPSFTSGTSQAITFCENATATPINAQMAITDADMGQTETWTITTAPSHGTLNGFPFVATSTGGVVTPTGLTFTPAAGYSGTDVFTIQISDGIITGTTTVNVTIYPTPVAGAITGINALCAGSSYPFSTSASGGAWISSAAAIASVSSGSGLVTGITNGVAIISYSVTNICGTAVATSSVTISSSASIAPVTGGATICETSNITLSDATSGGNWSSTNMAVATIGSSSGMVTGTGAGTATLIYSATLSCGYAAASTVITVNALPDAGYITGNSNVCSGSFAIYTDTVTGGTWSSSNIAIATIGSNTGLLSGLSSGTTNLTYAVNNSCGNSVAMFPVTIGASASIGAITGGNVVCSGSHITLSDTSSGGTWTSMNTASVAFGTAAGVATGIAAGSSLIIYSVNSSCGVGTATETLTVNPLSTLISAHNPAGICSGSLFSYIPAASYAGATFTWSRPYTGGISNPSATGTGDIAETLTNTTYYNVSVTYTYVVNALGCTNNQDVTVVVHPTPRLTSPLADTTCSGATFAYTPVAATPGTTWTWSRATVAGISPVTASGTGNISEALINGTSSPLNVDYSFALTVYGCTSLRDLIVRVTPQPPVASINPGYPTSVCSGTLNQDFGASASAPTGFSYTWSAVNANISVVGNGNQYCLVNFPNPGNADIILTVSAGGLHCIVKDTAAISVGAEVATTAGIIYNNGQFVYLDNSPTAFQWGYDNVNTLASTFISGANFQSYPDISPDFIDNYYWVMTTKNGCTQKTYYNSPMAVTNVQNSNKISIYPNPAASTINVDLNNIQERNIEVSIINMYGQIVARQTAMGNSLLFNIEELPSGCYIINCMSEGNKIAIDRFIKN